MINKCNLVTPIFIFTPEQITAKNKYRSVHSIQFMIESLMELSSELTKKFGIPLQCFQGDNNVVLKSLIRDVGADIIGYNQDFTPYAKTRDDSIRNSIGKAIRVLSLEDYTLFNFSNGDINNPNSGEPYRKFTPFYNTFIKLHPYNYNHNCKALTKTSIANKFNTSNFESKYGIGLKDIMTKYVGKLFNKDNATTGGRKNGIKMLNRSLRHQDKYSELRNHLIVDTSRLSSYLKYGCISIREVYDSWKYQFGINSDLIRQLYWREFYAYILYCFPENLGNSMNSKYDRISWSKNKRYLEAWTTGTTGFPVVDAAMRQLNTTGYMHNRGRLIVASFLVKTLGIDWREGEQYFAKHLIDYDPASNNGNWQWVAGSGVDSQPYFRIFNPWSQSKTHDPECEYIKLYVPELENIEPKHIHEWSKYHSNYSNTTSYPKPIVDYSKQKEIILEKYKRALY